MQGLTAWRDTDASGLPGVSFYIYVRKPRETQSILEGMRP
ncbi:hypothetical protein SAMN02799616_00096 [Paenibacillus sp. UNC499MF]|nr:hypothetical protein SAMN02799616_00096 [Paenibacillus sp. UNC499MF]